MCSSLDNARPIGVCGCGEKTVNFFPASMDEAKNLRLLNCMFDAAGHREDQAVATIIAQFYLPTNCCSSSKVCTLLHKRAEVMKERWGIDVYERKEMAYLRAAIELHVWESHARPQAMEVDESMGIPHPIPAVQYNEDCFPVSAGDTSSSVPPVFAKKSGSTLLQYDSTQKPTYKQRLGLICDNNNKWCVLCIMEATTLTAAEGDGEQEMVGNAIAAWDSFAKNMRTRILWDTDTSTLAELGASPSHLCWFSSFDCFTFFHAVLPKHNAVPGLIAHVLSREHKYRREGFNVSVLIPRIRNIRCKAYLGGFVAEDAHFCCGACSFFGFFSLREFLLLEELKNKKRRPMCDDGRVYRFIRLLLKTEVPGLLEEQESMMLRSGANFPSGAPVLDCTRRLVWSATGMPLRTSNGTQHSKGYCTCEFTKKDVDCLLT